VGDGLEQGGRGTVKGVMVLMGEQGVVWLGGGGGGGSCGGSVAKDVLCSVRAGGDLAGHDGGVKKAP